MTLKELIKSKEHILLDGAVGTELEYLGYQTTLPLWSASATFDAPDLLQEVHQRYCDAGADIITANTFRSSRYTFAKIGQPNESDRYCAQAVTIARRAVQLSRNTDVLVAGSIAPLEDCYDPSVVPDMHIIEREYHNSARQMSSTEADLCLIETMINRTEAVTISRIMNESGLPYLISFTADEDGMLLDGTPLIEIIEEIAPYNPDGVLINCRQTKILTTNLQRIQAMKLGIPYGAYGNVPGQSGGRTGMRWDRGTETDIQYGEEVKRWIDLGARLFGGCCGTTPDTIRLIDSILSSKSLQEHLGQ